MSKYGEAWLPTNKTVSESIRRMKACFSWPQKVSWAVDFLTDEELDEMKMLYWKEDNVYVGLMFGNEDGGYYLPIDLDKRKALQILGEWLYWQSREVHPYIKPPVR